METKERTEGRLRRLLEQPGTFLKWVLFAGVIGLAAGGVSSAFYYALNAVTALREANPWLLWLLPLGGVAIVLLYRICGMEKDRGTNFVLVAVRENQPLRLRTAPLIFAGTVLTHLLGGSSGREGAILQIGGSLSSKIGRWMHLDDKDSRIITMCGMSAAFSALFGTPLTAAMFAMEVTSVGVLYYAAIVPCVLSAIIGLWVAQLCGVPPTAFSLQGVPNLTPVTLLQCIGMGVLFALLSILFCRMMHAAPRLYDKYLPNPVARAAAGGALVIALTFGVATLPNGAEMRSTLIRGRFCPLLDDQTDLEELMSGEGAASEPSIEEAIAPMPSDKPTVSSAPNAIPEGSIPAAQESPEQKAGRFKRKCAAVADTFLLSRKETEVLFLLAKGRNSAAIQEALYISAGTANTHMRHIYRKLDVHSQHELIDLVESMVVD